MDFTKADILQNNETEKENKNVFTSLIKSFTTVSNDSEFKVNDSIYISNKTKREYHDQRLKQSKWAFWFSIGSSVVGFVVIIWSISRGIQTSNPEWPGMIGGIVTEAVSVMFYSLSNKANEKITEFFNELTKDEKRQSAIKLAHEVQDKDMRDNLMVKLSLHLVGINEDKICKNTKEVCNKEGFN